MTTEEDFIRHLDSHPDDWMCRLVFADWLEEQGDGRAVGIRVLGQLRRWPKVGERWAWTHSNYGAAWDHFRRFVHTSLPTEWWQVIYDTNPSWRFYTRQAAEDAAALAFPLLPEELQAALLTTEVLV